MKTKFTKGEWKARCMIIDGKEVANTWSVGSEDVVRVASLSTFNGKANAHLIAVAPEMYDMLNSIENDANQIPPFLWDKIQTVLAKARGEHDE